MSLQDTPFTPMDFSRMDESEDSFFYEMPRLVVHIDDQAIEAVGELFREEIPPASRVLDLLSSWRSHWPKGHPKQSMTGLGLNSVEMADNPDLDDYVVHDLNEDPVLPFDDESFDAAVITVSIQYITRPVEVFREVNRTLKPGGPFLVVFSNRMFVQKAVRIWTMSTDGQRAGLVRAYFNLAGNFEEMRTGFANPETSPPGDPVYLVMGKKAGA